MRARQVAWRTADPWSYFVEVRFCTETVKDQFQGQCGCAGDLEAGPTVVIGQQTVALGTPASPTPIC